MENKNLVITVIVLFALLVSMYGVRFVLMGDKTQTETKTKQVVKPNIIDEAFIEALDNEETEKETSEEEVSVETPVEEKPIEKKEVIEKKIKRINNKKVVVVQQQAVEENVNPQPAEEIVPPQQFEKNINYDEDIIVEDN